VECQRVSFGYLSFGALHSKHGIADIYDCIFPLEYSEYRCLFFRLQYCNSSKAKQVYFVTIESIRLLLTPNSEVRLNFRHLHIMKGFFGFQLGTRH
jgi:hypothetical protein